MLIPCAESCSSVHDTSDARAVAFVKNKAELESDVGHSTLDANRKIWIWVLFQTTCTLHIKTKGFLPRPEPAEAAVVPPVALVIDKLMLAASKVTDID